MSAASVYAHIHLYAFNTFARFNKSLSRIMQSNLLHIFTCCEAEYFSEKRLPREVSLVEKRISLPFEKYWLEKKDF